MDVTLFRSAMLPVIREQHDCFPMITDPEGKMVVGNIGSHVPEVVNHFSEGIEEGNVIFLSVGHVMDGWALLVVGFR